MIAAHRNRALSPERPKLRGTAQNPDVFFQAREACNTYYAKCAGIVQKHMDKFAKLVGRQYHLFDYIGAPDADRVIVVMGSGAGVVEETVDKLVAEGQKIGMVVVRLFRPWDSSAMVAALPKTVKRIAVLDRTKEPGAAGEPLYQDVITALVECWTAKFSPLPLGEGPVALTLALSQGEGTEPAAEGHFRPLRPVVEGVYARDGRRRLRGVDQDAAEAGVRRRHRR